MSPCPRRELLQRLLADQMAGREESAVCEHVETCPACQARLEELTAAPGRAAPPRPGSHHPAPARSGLSDDHLHRLRGLLPPAAPVERPGPAAPTNWPDVPGYEVVREIGRGGMAVVYEARHLRLNRRVALKMILAGELATPEQLVRFCAEGEILARLRHPNIVQIYEVGTHGKQPYMALELMEGGSLAGALAGKPLQPRPAAELVEALARAVDYAHGQRIVHRDLNPANVLLSGENDLSSPAALKVTDFGLAKHLDHDSRLTQSGHVMGTPSYMAPEQVRGRPEEVGPHTDVYALGAVLYEGLTGRPPFQAPTSLEVMNQVAELEPMPPSRLQPGVPRDLEVICLKCLEKDPPRRYAGAAALADDLRRFLDGVPVRARRVATVERAWRWARRRPAVAGLLAGVALSLLAGTAASSYFAVKAGRRAGDAERAGREKQLALDEARQARRQSDLRSAQMQFRAGLAQCEAGFVDRGLFTLLDAWRTAPEDAAAFRRVLRVNLAAWSRQLSILEHVLEHPRREYVLTRFVGAGGEALITWDIPDGRQAVRWDATTGRPLGPPFRAPDGEGVVDVNHEGTLVSIEKGLNCLVRDLATGQPVGAEFRHRVHDQPAWGGLALFREPGQILVTRSMGLGEPQRYRHFWRLPGLGTAGPVESLATIRLEHGDAYHVTAAEDGNPVAVVLRQPTAAPGIPPQAEFWDLTSGKRIPALAAPPGRADPRSSWDGGTILSVDGTEARGFFAGAEPGVRWWDAASGRLTGEPWRPRRPAQQLAPAADGQILVTRGQDHRVRLFDLARGLQRGGDILTTGFPGREYDARVGVSPDGSRLATASRDGVVRLWQTRRLLPQHTNASSPRAPASGLPRPHFDAGTLSGDGRAGLVRSQGAPGAGRLVTGAGEPLASPLRQTHLAKCAFSPDGTLIATSPDNHNFGGKTDVMLWDRAGRPRGVLHQYRYIHSLAFSPDGRTLAVGCVGGVFLWDVAALRLRHLLRETTTAGGLTFSPDGTRLAVANVNGWRGAGAGVRLWDVRDGKPVGAFLAGAHPPSTGPFFALAFADGGQTLRVFDFVSGNLHALDARTGEVRQPPLALPQAEAAVFRPDGAALASSISKESVQQWDAATGERAGALLEMPQSVAGICYSPDGQTVAVSCQDRSVRMWDAASGAPLGPPLLHQAKVLDLRFTPESDSLAVLTAEGRMHTWPLARPVADDPDRMEWWLQVSAGAEPENDALTPLAPPEWRRRRDRLRETWPEPDPALGRPLGDAEWHDGRARDAEADGNVFAALRHLDGLSALRPEDWRPHARKGSLLAAAGDQSLAESAYRLAARRAPAAALQDWHRQNASACLGQKQWGLALRHLDWLAAAGGEGWQVHADRATALGHLGRPGERDAARGRWRPVPTPPSSSRWPRRRRRGAGGPRRPGCSPARPNVVCSTFRTSVSSRGPASRPETSPGTDGSVPAWLTTSPPTARRRRPTAGEALATPSACSGCVSCGRTPSTTGNPCCGCRRKSSPCRCASWRWPTRAPSPACGRTGSPREGPCYADWAGTRRPSPPSSKA